MGFFSKKQKAAEDGDGDGKDASTKNISLEFRQSWTVRLGSEDTYQPNSKKSLKKKKSKNLMDKSYVIKNIDRDDLEEDRTFAMFFSKIEQAIELRLHPPSHYSLVYLYPNSPLKIRVDMDNHTQMMKTYDKFGKLSKKQFGKLTIRIVPRDPSSDMFVMERVKTVHQKLDNRNAINRFLADQFTKGRVDLHTFSHIMAAKLADAKAELYGIVPDGEREHHDYLIVQKEKKKKNVSPAELYDKGKITIEEFEDIMFPELKAKREKMNATYPRPEKLDVCVICNRADVASISCLECNHKACSDCVYREFTTHAESRPFLLMHHIFCCKNGHCVRGYLKPNREIIPERKGEFTIHPNANKEGVIVFK